MTEYIVPDLTMGNTLSIYSDLKNIVTKNEMNFDFSEMSNFDPFTMLTAGAIMRDYRNKNEGADFYIKGYEDKSYVGNMVFLIYISPKLKIRKMPGEAWRSNNYIPITTIQ